MIRRLIAPALATLVGLVILVSLGVWQVHRLDWKEALIARVAARIHAGPVAAPGPLTWPSLDLAGEEYLRVVVHGRFINTQEIYVIYTLTEPKGPVGGVGYQVMTPFQTDAGWIVWVNRGFVPTAKKYGTKRPEGLIEGETTVTGLLRQPHGRSWFMPGDGFSDNEWFSRDPKAWEPWVILPSSAVAPYIVDADYDPSLPGGLPQGGETIAEFPNSHLGYAITWFGLAGALLVVFVLFARKRLKAGE
ncbi:MAG: SURF1 family protein [Bauldia sp.]